MSPAPPANDARGAGDFTDLLYSAETKHPKPKTTTAPKLDQSAAPAKPEKVADAKKPQPALKGRSARNQKGISARSANSAKDPNAESGAIAAPGDGRGVQTVALPLPALLIESPDAEAPADLEPTVNPITPLPAPPILQEAPRADLLIVLPAPVNETRPISPPSPSVASAGSAPVNQPITGRPAAPAELPLLNQRTSVPAKKSDLPQLVEKPGAPDSASDPTAEQILPEPSPTPLDPASLAPTALRNSPPMPLLSRIMASSEPLGSGTAIAREILPMNDTLELEKSAEFTAENPGLQSIPEFPAVRSRSREEAYGDSRESRDDFSSSNIPFATTLNTGSTVAREQIAPIVESSVTERLARVVMDGVAQFRQTGNESVSIVLKPDAGTELVLRVTMHDGALSAQLHFGQGDRAGLEQHWDDLQRRLSEQGVRLHRSEDFTSGQGSMFADSQRRAFVPRPEPASASVSTRGSSPAATTVRAPGRTTHGFETWA